MLTQSGSSCSQGNSSAFCCSGLFSSDGRAGMVFLLGRNHTETQVDTSSSFDDDDNDEDNDEEQQLGGNRSDDDSTAQTAAAVDGIDTPPKIPLCIDNHNWRHLFVCSLSFFGLE